MQLLSKLSNTFFKTNKSFPIYSVKDNEIRSLNGTKSYCYHYSAPDLEQLVPNKLSIHYVSLNEALNSLQSSTWLKFYRWNKNEILINSNIDQLILGPMLPTKLMGPLSQFFGGTNPYSDIDFFENYLTLNDEFWSLIQVEIPPETSLPSFLDDFNCDYILSIKKLDSTIAKKELSHKRRSQGVTLNSAHQNHEGEAAYDEANKLLKDITTSNESLFKVSLIFVVKDNNRRSLYTQTRSLINALTNKGARAFIETNAIDYYFSKILPGIKPCFLKGFKTNSAYLANLLPNHKNFIHKEGIGIYARDGFQINLDIFDENSHNQNWLITGSSGQGKSFLTASLVYEYAKYTNLKIGIFDLGSSLNRVAKYFGASDLTTTFNPLQFRDPEYLKTLILSVIGDNELTRIQKGVLYEAIEANLNQDVYDFRELIFNLSKVIPNIEYYFSELWQYFDYSETELPDIFYLDIENKPKEIIAPYLIFAKKLLEASDSWTLSIFDECWHIFDKCPEILREKAKTSRKKQDANIFITQEIVELAENYKELSKAIIANTYGKIYFNQPDLNHSVLNDFDKRNIQMINSKKGKYSEFYYQSIHHKKIARFYPDALLYELCNSERDEIKKQERFIKTLKGIISYPEAINRYVELKYGESNV